MAKEDVWFVINRIKFVDLNVYAFGYQQCEPGYSFGQTIRDHYVLHYVVSGFGHYSINGRSYDIGPGECFFIPQNVVHSYHADLREPWMYYWINFGGLRAETLLIQAGLRMNHPVIGGFDTAGVKSVFEELFATEKTFNDKVVKILGCTFRIFGLIAESIPRLPPVSEDEDKIDILQIAVDYICKNYPHDINVTKISAEVKVVRSYLYLLFKEKLGLSPSAFLVKVRMERARDLLTNSSLNITEVAYSVGYRDVYLFSRAFKNYHKINPREFKHYGGYEPPP
jgi:AraC-like DNA-binding protein